MTRVVSRARNLRLDLAARLGRPVSVEEVAEGAGIARTALTRIELNQTERIDFDTITRLCKFYGVGIGDLLTLEEEDAEERYNPALLAA